MEAGEVRSFVVEPGEDGQRLDQVLARRMPEHSRSFLQKLIRSGRIELGGKSVDQVRFAVRAGVACTVMLPDTRAAEPSAGVFDYPILFEDDELLVINKPAGVVVHPGAGNDTDTVLNALYGRYPGFGQAFGPENDRPGIVHRLDKDTSGCLVIAKTPGCHFKLTGAFAAHEVKKMYLAVTGGVPRHRFDTLRGLIGRHPVNRQKMAMVDRNGKDAVTTYRVLGEGLSENKPYGVLAVRIKTGRTHQIRVHLASLGVPVGGDVLYGGDRKLAAPRQLLHAWRIAFRHPSSGEALEFTAPVPDDMRFFLDRIDLSGVSWMDEDASIGKMR